MYPIRFLYIFISHHTTISVNVKSPFLLKHPHHWYHFVVFIPPVSSMVDTTNPALLCVSGLAISLHAFNFTISAEHCKWSWRTGNFSPGHPMEISSRCWKFNGNIICQSHVDVIQWKYHISENHIFLMATHIISLIWHGNDHLNGHLRSWEWSSQSWHDVLIPLPCISTYVKIGKNGNWNINDAKFNLKRKIGELSDRHQTWDMSWGDFDIGASGWCT